MSKEDNIRFLGSFINPRNGLFLQLDCDNPVIARSASDETISEQNIEGTEYRSNPIREEK